MLGPVLGGWLTENLSWHYAFSSTCLYASCCCFCCGSASLNQRPDWSYLREGDWFGISGLILGLGGLTVVLEEGHREYWFEIRR